MPREARPIRLHVFRILPIVVILGLLVHVLLPRLDTIEDSLKMVRTLLPWAIAWAFFCEALSYLANGALLQSIVHIAGERLTLRRSVAIEIGAGTVALVAAGALGFGAAIYKWTRNAGITTEGAMLASWLPSLFDTMTLVIFALISAVELLIFHRLSRATMIALMIVVSILTTLVATLIVLLVRSDWMMAVAARAARIVGRVFPEADESIILDAAERAARTWQMMRAGAWIRPAICSLLVLTFDVLCLRYAFLAVGQHLYLSVLLAGYGVPMLLGRASFLPGGIAVIEVAMAALFSGLGVMSNVAVVGVLTYRLISFWIPTAIGIPIAITLQARKRAGTGVAAA
ncbi:MAG TPA: YbhN family protein [Thermoanaerobaculia bacterium]|jgi:hypothetical protein|nr:YbhN family protein [Thermoanaerobaculia bacterium]